MRIPSWLPAAMIAAVIAVVVVIRLGGDDSPRRMREQGVIGTGYAVQAPHAGVDGDVRTTGESQETNRRIAKRRALGRTDWVQVPLGRLNQGFPLQPVDTALREAWDESRVARVASGEYRRLVQRLGSTADDVIAAAPAAGGAR